MTSILLLIVAFMALIIIHELGHLVAARMVGMHVEKFSLFMGRALIKKKIGPTEYGLGWLPLGGYVKISGMTPDEEVDEAVADRAYWRQPLWKKVVAILAGPFTNIAVGLALFAVFYWTGQPEIRPAVSQVAIESPAAQAGLQPGDAFVQAKVVGSSAAPTERAITLINENPGKKIAVTMQRDGERFTKVVTPIAQQGEGVIGVDLTYAPIGVVRLGFMDGITQSVVTAKDQTVMTAEVLARFPVDSEAREQMSSVVGITAVANDFSQLGLFLLFIGSISLALGIINLVPIYPLDGGQIVMAVLQKLRGRPLGERFLLANYAIGIGIMLVIFAFALRNDILLIQAGGIIP